MGGAPSRETLVRHIVRDPRVSVVRTASISDTSAAIPQQPEIILIPLIPDYFPSSASPLFQQLASVRREPAVSYYYRDARSTSTEHAVVHEQVGSDKELYNLYMSLSEQRLMETDNELIALSRAGRVVSPVPCAVAFVYNANAASAAAAATINANVPQAASSSDGTADMNSNNKRKDANKTKKHRRGKQSSGGFNKGYMTIENTVRVPHHSLRVRIFGFVGDTRFCPPSMLPSQAAKSPMCLTIFLSKNAGGNHRVQVTLLAAHTYVKQLQEIGILRQVEDGMRRPMALTLGGVNSANHASNGVGGGFSKAPLSSVGIAVASTGDMDLLAGLRCTGVDTQAHFPGADPYGDPYAEPYSVEERTDTYALRGNEEQQQQQQQQQPFAHGSPRGAATVPFEGLGITLPSSAVEVTKEIVLRRPLEMAMHRADVPALCYVRELRARMDQDVMTALSKPAAPSTQTASSASNAADQLYDSQEGAGGQMDTSMSAPGDKCNRYRPHNTTHSTAVPSNADGTLAAFARTEDPCIHLPGAGSARDEDQQSLKRLIQTFISEEELRGSVDTESMGRVLLWASRFYATHFEKLIGGEATKLRQELAQRNLSENPLEGTLFLTEDEPRPPKALPASGDVWITPHDTYMEVRDPIVHHSAGVMGGCSNASNSGSHFLRHEMESWRTVPAGSVLRYVASNAGEDGTISHAVATEEASGGAWHVSKNEFAEDILLSLCRSACHVSRYAPPLDEHWLLNRETGLPEGLTAGLLIWREQAAGQIVYYGTVPDFIKQWMQAGAEVEATYRHQFMKTRNRGDDMTALATLADGANGKYEEEGLSGAADDGRPATSNTRHSTSITVVTSSAVATATTAASRGLHSSYDGKSSANRSSVSGGRRVGSSKERGKDSHSTSMARYSVHTGFVCTPDEDVGKALNSQSGTPSPAGNGPTSSATVQHLSGAALGEAKRTRTQRVFVDNSIGAKETAQSFTAVAGRHSLSSSVGRYNEASLSNSLPAYQRSRFAVLVESSRSLVRTPGSAGSTVSSSFQSYSNLDNAELFDSLSRSTSNPRAAYASSPSRQSSRQGPATVMNLSNACWIGVPDAGSRDGDNTPTVNVVVKQRRSVRLNASSSLPDSATHSDSRAYTQTRGDVPGSTHANIATQPITVGSLASRSTTGGVGSVVPIAQESLPINIFGSRDSSSGERFVREGGHSSFQQGQSCSLLSGDGALISHATATFTDPLTRPPPRQSAAMDIRHGQNTNLVGTPLESSSLKWMTSITARPASMRGASVTFASGSTQRGSLLHSSRYQEPCQSMLSRSASLSAQGQFASSASSTGSFLHKQDALRPLPLFVDAAEMDGNSTEENSGASLPAQNGFGGNVMSQLIASGAHAGSNRIATAPVTVVGSGGAGNSRRSSAAYTPRPENMSGSAKSPVGSGKYRWDWRGVAWNA